MNKLKSHHFLLGVMLLLLASCKEEFDLVVPYTDQTVVYAFLQHNDPWDIKKDTNFIVVNKAFVGELNAESMAGVSDSVNYPDYSKIQVSLQKISGENADSSPIGAPIVLNYMRHPKDSGLFANDNNIVFYTTAQLMPYQDVSKDPTPDYSNPCYYRISVKKEGQKEVYGVTKMIRGIVEGRPFNVPETFRKLEFGSSDPNYKQLFQFKSNLDARVYQLNFNFYYYEKRTDNNVYIKKIDMQSSPYVTESKNQKSPSNVDIRVSPNEFFGNIQKKLKNTDGVIWRAIKITKDKYRPETHSATLTLGSQESYVYNQVTQPSEGIVQEKPLYTNLTNGVGLFTSKWSHSKSGFELSKGTLDSLCWGKTTKNLKFLTRKETYSELQTIDHTTVIKDY